MIRFISIILFLVVFFILTLPVVLISLIIGLFNKRIRDNIAFFFVQNGFRFVLFLSGVKVEVSGQENIPDDKAVLYIGNHNGFFDVVSGYALAKGLTGFISKKEFMKIPGLNWWMYLVNCPFLDRSDARAGLKTIIKSADLIKAGVSIFVFPEGTRSRDGRMGTFKEGTFKIATKTNCPIIPVAYTNTAAAFEENFPKVKPVTITVTYCEPIYTSKLSKEEKKNLPHITQSRIQKVLDEKISNTQS